MSTKIRPATADDLAAVVAIYDHEVALGHGTFQIEPSDPGTWRARIVGTEEFWVAEVGGVVAGFAYAGWFRERAAYHRTRETSIYLAEEARGCGLGTTLYAALLDRLRQHGIHTVLAVVALPNEASLRLHAAAGFNRVGLLQEVGDKFDRLIDLALLQKMLDPADTTTRST